MASFNLSAVLGLQLARSAVSDIRRELESGLGSFEIRVTGLRQIGTTRQEVVRLTQDISTLSKALGVQAGSLADASVQFKRAGVAAGQMGQALKVVADASRTPFFGTMQQNTAGAVAAMKAFRLSASDLKSTFDGLSALSQNYSVDANQLLHSVATMGAGFRQSGNDVKQLASIMAIARDSAGGLDSAIDGAVKHAASRLLLPSTQTQLRRLGIELKNERGEFIGMAEAIELVGAKLKGLSATDPRRSQIVNSLGGVRQALRLNPLFERSSEIRRANLIANLGGIPTEAQAGIQLDTLSGKMSKVEQSFASMSRSLLSDTSIKSLIDLSFKGADALAHLAQSMSSLVPAMAAIAALPALKSLGTAYMSSPVLGRRLGRGAKVGFALAAPAIAESILGDNPAGRGIGGVASGALLGSFAGPWGAAIGAAIGGLTGFTTALRDSAKKIEQEKFSQFQSGSDQRINDLASGATTLTTPNIRRVAADLNELEKHNRSQALASAGGSGTDYFSALSKTRQENFGRISSQELTLASRIIDDAARRPGATGQGVYQGFASSEFGSALTRNLVGMGRAASDVEGVFRRLADSSVRAANAERGQSRLAANEATTSFSLVQLAKGLESVSLSSADLGGRAKLFSSTLSGKMEDISRPDFTHSLALPGTTAFTSAVGRLTPMMGQYGPDVQSQAASLDQLKKVLPSILDHTQAGGFLEDRSFAEKVIEGLHGAKGISPSHVGIIQSHLDAMSASAGGEGTFQKKMLEGSSVLADELTNPISNPLLKSLKTVAEQLDSQFHTIIASAGEYQTVLRNLIVRQAELGTLQLNQRLFQARVTAERVGRPSDFLSMVSIDEMNRPFRQNQEALTGFRGGAAMSADTIAGRLRGKLVEAESLRSQRDRTSPASQESVRLAGEFAHTQSSVVQLRQALVNLTDVAKQTAASEQRLAVIEQDRASRQSYGEHFLGSDFLGRIEMIRSQRLLGIAARQNGHIGNLPIAGQQLVMSTLNNLGNARLPAFGGISAADMKRLVVERTTGIKLDKVSENEKKSLLSSIAQAHERAIQAQTRLMEFEKGASAELHRILEDTNARFIADLRSVFFQQSVIADNTKAAALKGNLGELRSPSYSLLRRLNITQQELTLLQAPTNQSALADYAKYNDQLKAARGTSLRLPATFDLEMESSLVQTPRGIETRRSLSNSVANQKIISDALLNSGIQDENTQRDIYKEFRNHFSPEADPRKLLQQSFDRVKQLQIGQAIYGMEKARGQLGARTGMDAAKLEAILSEYVKNTKAMSDALASVKNIDELTKKISDLVDQLKATTFHSMAKGRLFGLAGGGHIPEYNTLGQYAKGTDTVPAMLSPGEFVINARQTKKHRRLLDEINSGQHDYKKSYLYGDNGPAYFASGGEVAPLALNMMYQQAVLNRLSRRYRVSPQTMLMYLQHGATKEVRRAIRADRRIVQPPRNYRPSYIVPGASSLDEIRGEQGRHPQLDDVFQRVAKKNVDALREQQRQALVRAGAAQRRRFGVGVAAATSLDEIRQRKPAFAIADRRMASPSYIHVSTNAPPVRAFAEGGFVDGLGRNLDVLRRSGHGGISPAIPNDFTSSMNGFSGSLSNLSNMMTSWSGTAAALSKAMEAMPRTVQMSGLHTVTHAHMGLDGLRELREAIEQSHEEKTTKLVHQLLKKVFPQAGIL